MLCVAEMVLFTIISGCHSLIWIVTTFPTYQTTCEILSLCTLDWRATGVHISLGRAKEFCILVVIMDSHKHIIFTCSFKCDACRRYWTQQLMNFPKRFSYCPGCNQRTEAYYVVSKICETSNRFTNFLKNFITGI